MRLFRYLAVVISMLCIGTHLAAADATKSRSHGPEPASRLDLGGGWQFKPISRVTVTPDLKPSDSNWQQIQVPSNWYLQGKDIHGKAWYQKRISIPAQRIGQQAMLVFSGVDYIADVWLNGRYLGHHEGYFQSFEFDITQHLVAGHNILTVLVDSPLEAPQDWSFNKRLVKGIFSHHDTRPGGAWSDRGQEKNTGGIWGPVAIDFSREASLRMLTVTPRRQADDWRIQVDATAISHVSHETNVTLEAEMVPENFQGERFQVRQSYRLQAGQDTISLALTVKNPELWWPAEYGKPNLYRLKLRLLRGKELLDEQQQVFGVRQVSVDEGLRWIVNGHRIFLRGTNYIASQWLAEMTPEKFKHDLDLMQAAHINAIRVHAHVTSPAFYALCDRMGLLVMQDFPLLWGYTDDEAFVTQARLQAKDMVHGLWNHPAIIAWTLHNEPPWDAPWMAQKYPDYRPDKNLKLDNLLYEDVKALDTTRVVRRESATKEHEWLGWYSGVWQDFARPAPTPWVTEYGAQALPALPSLKKLFAAAELWPDNESDWQKWEYHNFQRRETFDLAHVPMGRNTDEFISNTQAYQANLIQYATENYRRQRYAPIAAVFQFMFVEDWPSINWGIVDYWRQPKPGYDALKMAFQPVLPSIAWLKQAYAPGESATLGLWAINDRWLGYETARYEVTLNLDGKPIQQLQWDFNLPPDSGQKLRDFALSNLQPGAYALEASIKSAQGELLGTNVYRFNVR